MDRRSDAGKLAAFLAAEPNQRASRDLICARLGWTNDKLERALKRAGPTRFAPVRGGSGGMIAHVGTERGPTAGIYRDLAMKIEQPWGTKELGLRNITVIVTSRAGSRGAGAWTHPDMVMAADPSRRDHQSEPRRLHAIEVETAAGFDIRSVYQAHAQGRGADYTWVFGCRHPGVTNEHWERVEWAARELGVGLVTFERPGASTTWTLYCEPNRRPVTRDDREAFLDRAVGQRLRTEHEL